MVVRRYWCRNQYVRSPEKVCTVGSDCTDVGSDCNYGVGSDCYYSVGSDCSSDCTASDCYSLSPRCKVVATAVGCGGSTVVVTTAAAMPAAFLLPTRCRIPR